MHKNTEGGQENANSKQGYWKGQQPKDKNYNQPNKLVHVMIESSILTTKKEKNLRNISLLSEVAH
jgi:hypothetical protein